MLWRRNALGEPGRFFYILNAQLSYCLLADESLARRIWVKTMDGVKNLEDST